MTMTNNDKGILILRISLGVALLAHGLLKYFVFTLPGTVGYFESLGLPGFTAYLVFAGEIGAGLLLLLGIKTRLMVMLTLPILLGASIVHFPNGWVFSAEGGGWEYPVFMMAVCIALLFTGGGKLSAAKLLKTAQ